MKLRLFILSLSIFISLFGLSLMGDFAIDLQAEGLQGRRLKEFDSVAETIRLDVKRQLDEFIQAENLRDYTDYQYFRVPAFGNNLVPMAVQQLAAERSPLGDTLSHGMAYGYFQMDPNGIITAPFIPGTGIEYLTDESRHYVQNIIEHLKPALGAIWTLPAVSQESAPSGSLQDKYPEALAKKTTESTDTDKTLKGDQQVQAEGRIGGYENTANYKIESLDQKQQLSQMQRRSRDNVILNEINQTQAGNQSGVAQNSQAQRRMAPPPVDQSQAAASAGQRAGEFGRQQVLGNNLAVDLAQIIPNQPFPGIPFDLPSNEQVQIRVDPLQPVLVGDSESDDNPFGGQVFMLRLVQIEERRFLQGFRLDTQKLRDLIYASAQQATSIYQGMSFDLTNAADKQAAYSAILDFGFGSLAVNLWELDPNWIKAEISRLRYCYFGIVVVVFMVVALGVAGLWRSAAAQLKLAQQKDDFISAVSHELRTPLTSIRMYAEMLEKDYVKNDDKRREYYRSMRSESERLSRLIENVLDFSRMQRGRKQYDFKLGDINQCVQAVIDMMQPYAGKNGFTIHPRLGPLDPVTFDHDAVMQIVINLIDNAVKYARHAADKTIIVSTHGQDGKVFIDVEDHGPGVPHAQRQKVFEEFYRLEAEDTRETSGAGLGLALVQKFTEAHRGFVEILSAQPTGAIFRIALPVGQ